MYARYAYTLAKAGRKRYRVAGNVEIVTLKSHAVQRW